MTKKLIGSNATGYVALIASILLSVAGQLLMKQVAMAPTSWTEPSGLAQLVAALGVYSMGILGWIVALRTIKLAVAYSFSSLNYVGILAGSYWLFGELVTFPRLTGVALIFVGVLLVVLHDDGQEIASGVAPVSAPGGVPRR